MAARGDVKKVREAIGGLVELGVPMPEILARLENDEAGIGYPVKISRRMGYYHRTKFREEKARASTALDTTTASVEAAKQKAVDLLTRELAAHEARRAGKMGAKDAVAVGAIYRELDKIERRETGPRTRAKPKPDGQAAPEPSHNETALERLARKERENGSGPDTGKDQENDPQSKQDKAQRPVDEQSQDEAQDNENQREVHSD